MTSFPIPVTPAMLDAADAAVPYVPMEKAPRRAALLKILEAAMAAKHKEDQR